MENICLIPLKWVLSYNYHIFSNLNEFCKFKIYSFSFLNDQQDNIQIKTKIEYFDSQFYQLIN